MNRDLNPSKLLPERIVCLTDECTETLYLLGEADRIVGISGFTQRPAGVRKEKPIISTFLEAQVEEIKALEPDLVIGYSDLQAQTAKDLIAAGLTVWVNNHRDVPGILKMIRQLGLLVGAGEKAMALIERIHQHIAHIQQAVRAWPIRPKVYFEEWDEPRITGIQWVGEIIELAGGKDIFPEHQQRSLAKDRILSSDLPIIDRNPDIMLASWCGKAFKPERVRQRPGWDQITALKADALHEVPGSVILQPGPAALLEGLPLIHSIFQTWVDANG